jgi:hypothetical protein
MKNERLKQHTEGQIVACGRQWVEPRGGGWEPSRGPDFLPYAGTERSKPVPGHYTLAYHGVANLSIEIYRFSNC